MGRIGVRKPPQTTFYIIDMGVGWVGRGTETTANHILYNKDGGGVGRSIKKVSFTIIDHYLN